MPSDLQVDNIKDGSATKTLATLSSSAVTLHSDVTFPTGHMIFIKSQDRDGVGDVGNHTSFYPTTTSDLATKSFHLTLTSSEHAPFSKIKIDYSASVRMQEATHNFQDYRLVRWTGTGNISSETQLILLTIGNAAGETATEVYAPMVGSAIDDISSIGNVQINYALQYRNSGGTDSHSAEFYFGHNSTIKMQAHLIGII